MVTAMVADYLLVCATAATFTAAANNMEDKVNEYVTPSIDSPKTEYIIQGGPVIVKDGKEWQACQAVVTKSERQLMTVEELKEMTGGAPILEKTDDKDGYRFR